MSGVRVPVENRIARLLGERGWSDGRLAQAAGMSRMRVNRIKNRRSQPTVREALLLGAALGIAVDELFAPAVGTGTPGAGTSARVGAVEGVSS